MATEGTKENPWKLKTPPLKSDYEMYKDERDGKTWTCRSYPRSEGK